MMSIIHYGLVHHQLPKIELNYGWFIINIDYNYTLGDVYTVFVHLFWVGFWSCIGRMIWDSSGVFIYTQ